LWHLKGAIWVKQALGLSFFFFKHNRSLKVAVQGLDFMAHPLYILLFWNPTGCISLGQMPHLLWQLCGEIKGLSIIPCLLHHMLKQCIQV
jgi:hypothetical protein